MGNDDPNLRRFAFFTVVTIASLTAIATIFDYGRYSEQFQNWGLLGLLTMPSTLVFQLGYLIGVGVLFVFSFRHESCRGLRASCVATFVAIAVYCCSLLLLHEASKAGQFGLGAAFIVVIAGTFPSAGFLLLIAPILLLDAIRNSTA